MTDGLAGGPPYRLLHTESRASARAGSAQVIGLRLTRIVKNVSEKQFKMAYKVALSFAGLKVLIVDGLYNLPIW